MNICRCDRPLLCGEDCAKCGRPIKEQRVRRLLPPSENELRRRAKIAATMRRRRAA